MTRKLKINDRQHALLLSFSEQHAYGMREFGEPFGIGRLTLSCEGQPMAGLIRRGFVREQNNIFYITDAGFAALAAA